MWALKRRGLPQNPRNASESLWIAGLIMAIVAVLSALAAVRGMLG